MKRSRMLMLALLSALLFSVPFFQWGTGLILMVAFVPLLFIEDEMARRKKARKKADRPGSIIWYALLTFGLFTLLTTYWVYWATWTGIVASIIVNGGYMTLTFWVFHRTRRKLGDRLGYASLAIFWLAFEFLYIRAQVNFPWIVLGNGFAKDVMLIQWYEWTGALGGSLWVLVMNIVLFKLVKAWLAKRPGATKRSGAALRSGAAKQSVAAKHSVAAKQSGATKRSGAGSRFLAAHRTQISWALALLLIPMLASMLRFLTYEEKDDPYEMVVLQPNIDPYLKFTDMSQEEQTTYLLQVADSLVTPTTDYIIGPETFLNNNVWEAKLEVHPDILRLREFLEPFPEAKLVLGATVYKLYSDPSDYTSTSRPISNGEFQYDRFNSAFQLDASGEIPIYHKSMLVTGVEKMPHKELLSFLEKLVVNLGGTMRGNGYQEYREAFPSPQDGTRVGPVICWESVFGEYVTDYVGEAGANFLFIITNDGWWKNTAGHRQHNTYARLRAIETRRGVARSANTGISSLIDQRGVELARVDWWERSGLRGNLNKNDALTFYVKHGDFLGRIAVLLTVILLLYSFVFRFIKMKK